MSLTLITMTGDRPDQFALCEKYMAAQTFQDWVEWIVVDDGYTPATVTHPSARHFRLEPGKDPHESFMTNLSEALSWVGTKHVAFIEDDDFYRPTWLSFIADRLYGGYELVGESPSVYYNLTVNGYRTMRNNRRASLCQTACTTQVARQQYRVHADGAGNAHYDLSLWLHKGRTHIEKMDRTVPMVVGLKAHPTGRKGIGVGHQNHPSLWTPDPDRSTLRLLLGDAANNYGGPVAS